MYQDKLSPVYLENTNDVILDLWLGSSEVCGFGASHTTMRKPTSASAPSTIPTSQLWDRWLTVGTTSSAPGASHGGADPDDYDWVAMPLASGGLLNGGAGYTSMAYGQALHYSQKSPVRASFDISASPYHYVAMYGASGGGTNSNTSLGANKITHFSPLVTSTDITGTLAHFVDGEQATVSGWSHFLLNYVTPAVKNLQLAGKRVLLGGWYVSISGDSLATYTNAEAASWGTNFAIMRESLESALGFSGIPVMILGTTNALVASADEQEAVRASQLEYAISRRDTTRYMSTIGYATMDGVHFNGQSTIDVAAAVTGMRYSTGIGLAAITKDFTS